MGVQLRKSESEALWRSESEAIAMIVKNDIYFVIFTVLEFVGSLILLNDIMASPLWKRQQSTEDNYLPQQEQDEAFALWFPRIDLRVEIGL
jgi:hypothetical protein